MFMMAGSELAIVIQEWGYGATPWNNSITLYKIQTIILKVLENNNKKSITDHSTGSYSFNNAGSSFSSIPKW